MSSVRASSSHTAITVQQRRTVVTKPNNEATATTGASTWPVSPSTPWSTSFCALARNKGQFLIMGPCRSFRVTSPISSMGLGQGSGLGIKRSKGKKKRSKGHARPGHLPTSESLTFSEPQFPHLEFGNYKHLPFLVSIRPHQGLHGKAYWGEREGAAMCVRGKRGKRGKRGFKDDLLLDQVRETFTTLRV